MSAGKKIAYSSIALLLIGGAAAIYILVHQRSLSSLLSAASHAESIGQLQDAYNLYHRAFARQPGDTQLHLAIARVARRLGKLTEAQQQVDRYLSALPGSTPGLVEKGQIAFDLEQYAQASEWFSKVLEKEPANSEALGGLGKCQFELGRYRPEDQRLITGTQDQAKQELVNQALSNLDRALQAGISDPLETRRYFVRCLLETNDIGKALPLAQALVQESPEDPRSHYLLAITLLADRQTAEARKSIQEAFDLARKPSEEYGQSQRLATVMNGYGRVCYTQGEMEQAVDFFIKATRNDDQLVEAYLNAASLLSFLNRNKEAMALLEDAIGAAERDYQQRGLEISGESALNLYQQANEAQRLHDIDLALNKLRRVVAMDSGFTQGFYELACIDLRRGNEAQAKSAFREVQNRAPNHLNSAYDLGALLLHDNLAEQAAACFKRIVDAKPSAVDARLNLAEAYRRLGQTDKANREYEEALKIAPNNPEVMTRLGYSQELQGKNEEALKTYQEVVSRSPSSLEPRYRLALYYLKQGKGNQAVAEIEKAMILNPNNERLTITLGDAIFATALEAPFAERTGLFLKSADVYNKVITVAQGVNLAAALTGKGNTELAMNHPLEALTLYDRALDALGLRPDRMTRALTLANKARAAFIAGKENDAIQAGLDALKTISDLSKAQYNVGCIYALKENWSGAKGYFQQATETDHSNVDAFYNLGIAFMGLKQNSDASRIFEENVENGRRMAHSSINLACLASQEGKWDSAMKYIQAAEKSEGNDPLAAANLAALHFRNGQEKEARTLAQRALDLCERNPDAGAPGKRAATLANLVLGLLYARGEQWQDAQRILEKAGQASPEYVPEVEIALGHVYRAQGQFVTAEERYLTVLKQHPNNPEVLNGLGDLYARSGDYENARDMLKRSLTYNRDQPQIREAQQKIETLWQEN